MPKKWQTNREYYYDWDILMLQCNKCLEIKPISAFNKSPNSMFWVREFCRDCSKKNYKENRDKILQERKEYYSANSDKKKEYQRQYYYSNSEHIKEQHKEYRDENIEKVAWYQKRYYNNNKDIIIWNIYSYWDDKTNELWFDWKKFHDKAHWYAYRHNLYPNECCICGNQWKIVMHHPSYENFDKWKEVVFVCHSCHNNIHLWLLDCPLPTDLVELKQNKNEKT